MRFIAIPKGCGLSVSLETEKSTRCVFQEEFGPGSENAVKELAYFLESIDFESAFREKNVLASVLDSVSGAERSLRRIRSDVQEMMEKLEDAGLEIEDLCEELEEAKEAIKPFRPKPPARSQPARS